MLAIVVETENWERYVRPSAEDLADLVRRVGGEGDRFLVLQRVPDRPNVFAQIWHENGGEYSVEHNDGRQHLSTATRDLDQVIAALTGWARADAGWDSALTWQPLDLPAAPEVPPLEVSDEERRQLEDRVRAELAGGYTSRVKLAELAEEYLVDGDRRPVSPEQARALADRLWVERVEEQAGWQGETDPERLTRAFAALDGNGVTARENFTCCRTCGQDEIGAEAAPGARGFVYFHNQCTEHAAEGNGLTLLYGGFDGTAETTTAIGDEVVAALQAVGLNAKWDRDPNRTITVPLDWRRRLVG
ncbi:hypothetical protein [Lentzea sp. NBRC 102530]|uniref:DUF6891 domain-containing protein n=1 Tax=Lentzea sp. NBRC 102530 TaxID=3032201 RepID=UPI0024A3E213|nr:hypothetical protein [Lentzea sp. NBRC 102530]GLY50497.1 hypothetical protein Lesp01_41530 [Lentzea sp. NBRC 102530]